MMREILFRGKRADNGEWVYGYLTRRPSAIQMPGYAGPWYIEVPPKDPDDNGGVYNVLPDTVGQYTEMIIKDDEKDDDDVIEIFEGDVIEGSVLLCGHEERYRGVVKYHEAAFGLCSVFDPQKWDYDLGDFARITRISKLDVDVIGNVYDNPELFEEATT